MKTGTQRGFGMVLMAFVLLVSAVPLLAQPISFQGRLTEADGTSVADGSHEVSFLLYTGADGGSPLWSEVHTVETINGVFSLLLGQQTPLPLDAFDEMPYLAIAFNGEELQPRMPLSAVPYAMQAHRLNQEALVAGANVTIQRQENGALRIASSGGAGGGLAEVTSDGTLEGAGTADSPLRLANRSVTREKLADEAVTGDKLADDALVAGANVTIQRQGNGALEITATGGGGGGLTSVSADGTLAGDGTAGSPLGLADASVTTAKVADAAVTGAKLADGALVAGTNVTIQRQGNGALQVASVGGGGLAQVTSDATLAGDGTSGSPLQVADGAVTGVKLADGALVAGANVTIQRQGNGALQVASAVTSDGTLSGVGTAGSPLAVSVPLVLMGLANDGVIKGVHNNGTFGYLGGNARGVYGSAPSSVAIQGVSTSSTGVSGGSTSGYGVSGSSSSSRGVYGVSGTDTGVYGLSASGFGVYGVNSNKWGALGSENYGVFGAGGSGFAAGFSGDVTIIGNLVKSSGAFKIDHPLDPAGKYLAHSFVESPDMMNVYNGNVTTDAQGFATVTLPDYFEALNRDFRYQLTVIGQFAQAIVAEKIQSNQFVIRTDKPGVEVSWQVTGIRQDAWAEEHRIVVEEDKPTEERGFYLHPRLFGQPQERSIHWARDPEMMRAIQERP